VPSDPASIGLSVLDLARAGRFADAGHLRTRTAGRDHRGQDGRLAGIQLAPVEAARPHQPWQPPDYADPDTFDEQDVTLGT
jgi:hypothetical protein